MINLLRVVAPARYEVKWRRRRRRRTDYETKIRGHDGKGGGES